MSPESRFEKYLEEENTNPQESNKDRNKGEKEKIHIGIDSVPPAIPEKRPRPIKMGGVSEIKHKSANMETDLQDSLEDRQKEPQQLKEKQQQMRASEGLEEIEQTIENPYSEDEAFKESSEMKAKIESGEATSYEEAEKLIDQSRLEEETEKEKTMEKLPDNFTENIHEVLKQSDITDSLMQLANRLQFRENERYSPLVYPEEIDRLRMITRNLESVIQQPKIDLKEIEAIFLEIRTIFDKMLESPQTKLVREDTDSLRAITNTLGNIRESSQLLANQFIALDKSEQQRDSYAVVHDLHQIAELANNKIDQIIHRLKFLDNYSY